MTEKLHPPKNLDLGQGERRAKWAGTEPAHRGPDARESVARGQAPLPALQPATPNGVKVTVMFEELLAAGHPADYDALLIRIGDGDQFGLRLHGINPNSKIPALVDHTGDKTRPRLRIRRDPDASGREIRRPPGQSRGSARAALMADVADGQRPPIWAAASAISTPTPPTRWNTRSTASRWRPSASSTC